MNGPPPGSVDLWRLPLAADGDVVRRAASWLEDDELSRAAHFHVAADRDRFILRRAGLRLAVAASIGATPASVRIERCASGAPRIAGARRLALSTAHRGGLGLVAIAGNRAVGVDVDAAPSPAMVDDLARACLHPSERPLYAAAPHQQRPALIARLWTRKEAWLKLLGTGLGVDPRRICALDEAEGKVPARLGALIDLHPGPGLFGALAVAGTALPEIRDRALPVAALEHRTALEAPARYSDWTCTVE